MGYQGDRQGVKITKGFAKKLGSYINGPKNEIQQQTRRDSLFYDVRPAIISDVWQKVFDDENENNARWAAKADLIVTKNNGETIEVYNEEIQVYSPCDRNTNPQYPVGSPVFVLNRGQWEIVPPTGHLIGVVVGKISDASDDYINDRSYPDHCQYYVSCGTETYCVFSPLTGSQEEIPRLSMVLFQRNMISGYWEIFATTCY